ncbi:hypothetical protein [Streptomyces sp. NPDC051310]|uniref:hypothetical protein n=1 Tax=Streptomyces sp. NPDC051310 TaxID=3365649 RepID=UPI003787935F
MLARWLRGLPKTARSAVSSSQCVPVTRIRPAARTALSRRRFSGCFNGLCTGVSNW